MWIATNLNLSGQTVTRNDQATQIGANSLQSLNAALSENEKFGNQKAEQLMRFHDQYRFNSVNSDVPVFKLLTKNVDGLNLDFFDGNATGFNEKPYC